MTGFNLDEFLPYRLNVLAEEVSKRLSAIYAERFDLDVAQWRILANLGARGEATAQEIARLTMSHKSTISRAVQQLRDRGWIERDVSAEDKRSLTLSLTAEGKRAFQKILPLALSFERDLLAEVPAADAKALARGVSALELALRKSRDKRPSS